MNDYTSENIKLFAAFKNSLLKLWKDDIRLFTNKKKKTSISHRLSIYIEREVPYIKYVDLLYEIKTDDFEIYPDIILHNRVKDINLAIFWQDEYLSKKEQIEIKKLKEIAGESLVLAFAVLPDKPYFLIYQFETDTINYLHLDKENGNMEYLKQSSKDDKNGKMKDPLLFTLPKQKKAKSL